MFYIRCLIYELNMHPHAKWSSSRRHFKNCGTLLQLLVTFNDNKMYIIRKGVLSKIAEYNIQIVWTIYEQNIYEWNTFPHAKTSCPCRYFKNCGTILKLLVSFKDNINHIIWKVVISQIASMTHIWTEYIILSTY